MGQNFLYVITVNIFFAEIFSQPIQNITLLPFELNEGYVIDTPGCKIPYLDPYNDEIQIYLDKGIPPLYCWNSSPALIDSNLTHIYVIDESKMDYVSGCNSFSCCYQPFYRREVQGKESKNYPLFNVTMQCNTFNDSAAIKDEYIVVRCLCDEVEVYKDFFAFVQPFQNQKQIPKKPLNVFLLGLDSMSRLNFVRNMPQTYEFLMSINALEYKGFNKVGDNTFPNLTPMLTGFDSSELHKRCNYTENHFDNCPFIWNDYKKNDFATSFAEDLGFMGTYQFRKKGFKNQPTDYYWLFFDLVANSEIGNGRLFGVPLCYGSRFIFEVYLKYMYKFVERMQTDGTYFFTIFWTNVMTHQNLNTPLVADQYYSEFLKYMYDNGYLDNTILILNSDHGFRMGSINKMLYGMLESRLPMLYMRVPEWFLDKYPLLKNNLVVNTKRLINQFDIHDTLKDLINPYDIENKLKNIKSEVKKSYSLFEEIPKSRTCKSTYLSSCWCTCLPIRNDYLNKTIVEEISNLILSYLEENYMEVYDVNLLRYSNKLLRGNNLFEDYVFDFKTEPDGISQDITIRRYFKTEDENFREYKIIKMDSKNTNPLKKNKIFC